MSANLETRRLFLRPAQDLDEPVLSSWRATEDYRHFVFSGEKQRYHLQFMICRRRDGEPIGVAYTFSYNERDEYLFFSIFLSEKFRKRGYGAEASAMAICHIFDSVPLYKIYTDVMVVNEQALSMNRAGQLCQEGLLKGHVLYGGTRYDVARFAIHQETLIHLKSLLKRFQRR